MQACTEEEGLTGMHGHAGMKACTHGMHEGMQIGR